MDPVEYTSFWNETVKMLDPVDERIAQLEKDATNPARKAKLDSFRKLYATLLSELEQMHQEFKASEEGE